MRFFTSNPGLSSRVAHHIDFPDYTADELIAIAHLMLGRLNYEFGPEAETTFLEYIERRMRQPHFGNARSIRNALDRARSRAATRLFERGGTITRAELMAIEVEDLRKSRVFDISP